MGNGGGGYRKEPPYKQFCQPFPQTGDSVSNKGEMGVGNFEKQIYKRQKKDFGGSDKNMIMTDHGLIAKSKRIQEKNTAKGQGSLAAFFQPKAPDNAVKSSASAFNHYVIESKSYQKLIPGNNPEEQANLDLKTDQNSTKTEMKDENEPRKDECLGGFMSDYKSNMAKNLGMDQTILNKKFDKTPGTGLVIKGRLRCKDDDSDVPPDIDMSNLQIWSWNVNGIRAILKKNRI